MTRTFSLALASLISKSVDGLYGPSGVRFRYEDNSIMYNATGAVVKVSDDEGNLYVVRINAVELNRKGAR